MLKAFLQAKQLLLTLEIEFFLWINLKKLSSCQGCKVVPPL